MRETRHGCKDCGKSFLRADHLARHKLNHNDVRHKCDWPNCGKTFVRADVLKKHYRQQHQKTLPVKRKDKLKFVFMETKVKEAEKKEYPDLSGKEPKDFSIDELVLSDEMIRWLFGGIDTSTQLVPKKNTVSPETFELEEFEYPIQNNTLNFPFSTEQAIVDQFIMEKLEDALPSIKYQEEFKATKLSSFLENYWQYYHPQFPVLNKPSFSTRNSHPILLLVMIAFGAYINKSLFFADSIIVPLRWIIYSSRECKPPPKLWVVQSTVLLQTYEICCSSRELHERANIHRGIIIQMLKRSPIFGGNPWSKPSFNDSDFGGNTKEEWGHWIEDESMRRCALATFYLETVHAVVFGHDILIDLHDVKPNLPCNEQFWRTGKYSEKCLETPITLLAAIKSFLHNVPISAKGFSKKIILSGLIALSFEVKDRDFEFSISEFKSMKQVWQDKIAQAFKVWDLNVSQERDVPIRELYQSYTQMKHYDFMVYAGAPGRMNVQFSRKETELVSSRVAEWTATFDAKKAVVFIYAYLYNLLFDEGKPAYYKPNEDKVLYRKQVISHVLLILWCYNYSTCGIQTSSEDGHIHIQRICLELSVLAGKELTENVYKDIDSFVEVLDTVTSRENMVGLLLLFSSYLTDSSEIAREHSRLLQNCSNRSLGSKTIFCKMFE